jgi:hypothetical protein
MRTSIASATFLLLGVGAVAVSADDTTGSNLTFYGSDTLLQVTRDIMNDCDGAVHFNGIASSGNITGLGLVYAGGGSGVGANNMALNGQRLAPMSRALKNFEYCNNSPAYTLTSQATTNALLVAVDGVSIMANAVQGCSGDLPNNSSASANSSFSYTSTVDGMPHTYTIKNSLDALRLAFAGTDSASASYEGDYGCGGPIRKALLANWTALFSPVGTTCAAGSHKCDGTTDPTIGNPEPSGVSHLWRRADLSGTTDAFVTLVNLGVRKIGNNPATTPASFSYTINAFCNSVDANAVPPAATASGTSCTTNAQCPTLWGSKCVSGTCSGTKTTDTANLANGHIAIPCLLTTTTSTRVVGGSVVLTNPNNINQDCQVPGDTFMDPNNLATGIAMQDSVCQQGPVLAGDASTTGSTNNAVRTGVCHPGSLATFSDYADNDPIRVFCDADAVGDNDSVCSKDGKLGAVLPVLIPDVPMGGTAPSATELFPTASCDSGNTCRLSNTDPTDNGPCPAGGPRLLGRCYQPVQTTAPNTYNFNCIAGSANSCFGDTAADGRVYNLPIKRKVGTEGGTYITDSSFGLMVGSFFRIHQNRASSYAKPNTMTVTNSVACTQTTDTNQIGCLVASDPCSAGFAGREADKVNTTIASLNKALTVNTIAPRTTTATPDSTIYQLLDGVIATTQKKCAANTDCPASQPTCNTQFGLCYPSADVVYPLARRLFVASDIGLGNLQGGELQLAKCYGDNNILTPVIQNDNFVPVPTGAACLDYPEANSGLATSVYLNTCSGSSIGGANTDACAGLTGIISH